MSRFTDDELAKLPKWAASRIEALQRDVEYHRDRYVEATEGETDTEIVVLDRRIGLPNESRVAFGVVHDTAPNGYRSHRGIEVRWDADNECLEIGGSETFVVMPRSSNRVLIQRDRR